MAANTNMAAPELAGALERAVTGLHLLGATAKDYDAHTAAKGVLEKRVYVVIGDEGGSALKQRASNEARADADGRRAVEVAYAADAAGARRNKDVIGSLLEVDRIAQGIDVDVPVELLAYVDGNKSPAQYTLDTLARTVAHNESTLGKTAAMKTLWAQLDAELAATFPEDRSALAAASNSAASSSVKTEPVDEDAMTV